MTSWQMLEQRRLDGDEAIAAYRRFVVDYNESTLAIAAWSRLVDLQASEGAWRDERESMWDGVERRWRAHRAVVEARKAPRGVVRLFLDDDATVTAE